MTRRRHHFSCGTEFQKLTMTKNSHVMGYFFHDSQIVADEQRRKTELFLQGPEQFQHFGLDRNIEC